MKAISVSKLFLNRKSPLPVAILQHFYPISIKLRMKYKPFREF